MESIVINFTKQKVQGQDGFHDEVYQTFMREIILKFTISQDKCKGNTSQFIP